MGGGQSREGGAGETFFSMRCLQPGFISVAGSGREGRGGSGGSGAYSNDHASLSRRRGRGGGRLDGQFASLSDFNKQDTACISSVAGRGNRGGGRGEAELSCRVRYTCELFQCQCMSHQSAVRCLSHVAGFNE